MHCVFSRAGVKDRLHILGITNDNPQARIQDFLKGWVGVGGGGEGQGGPLRGGG